MNENANRNLHLPVYNIKAVARLVGLLPVTLRAWERRYGLPRPGRGEQGYRLYSEYDVLTLRWLKAQVESGLSIGRAAGYLNELRSGGNDPAAEPIFRPVPASHPSAPSYTVLTDQLLDALTHFDEPTAHEIMRRAFAIYAIDQVLVGIVQPALTAIGEAWQRGEMSIAVEHFATQFCMQHLHNILAAASPPTRPGSLVAACAPGEMHQIGLLILVIMLRWHGWDVKYLGPDLPLERLEEALLPIHPHIMMFSANRVETAQKLSGLPNILNNLPEPHPLVILGGQGFRQFRLPEQVPAKYLDGAPWEAIQVIEELMMRTLRPNGGTIKQEVETKGENTDE